MSLEPLTLDKEVCMQEEWHRVKRNCTFILLPRDLLLLDLDIGDDDRHSVAAALLLHIPLLLHCCCAVNCRCPCAVHCYCCHCIAVTPSIAVAIAPSIAVAVAPSITVIAIALPLCHPSSLPPPYCHPAFHPCRRCAIHRHCHRRCHRVIILDRSQL